jgi:hypothetical protein
MAERKNVLLPSKVDREDIHGEDDVVSGDGCRRELDVIAEIKIVVHGTDSVLEDSSDHRP